VTEINGPKGGGNKSDWSHVDSLLVAKESPASTVPVPFDHSLESPLTPDGGTGVPTPLIVPRPDLVASLGILAKLKANQLGRKVALEQLQAQYSGQLDALKETVSQAVKVHKTRIAVAAEEYLRTLDSKHLELLTQLGMRNAATRWKAVTDLTDMAIAKIKEIEGKDWPQRFIDDTMAKVFEVRERVANEIMKELSTEHSAEAQKPAGT
jgi:hypothetical protein